GNGHDALAAIAENMELSEGRDVVEAGIGAGIRDHDETVPHQNSATISHSRSPNASDFSGGQTSSQFQGGIQPQFPRRGMQPAARICLAGRGVATDARRLTAAWTHPGAKTGIRHAPE